MTESRSALNDAQRRVRNAEDFTQHFHTLSRAAVGVYVVRTREPHRLVKTLRNYVFSDMCAVPDGEPQPAFKVWSVATGWAEYVPGESAPQYDGNSREPLPALQMVQQLSGEGRSFGPGVYVYYYPHMVNLERNASMVALIKEYAHKFSLRGNDKKRLVLVLPLSWEVPTELEDDVTILDFDPPSFAERVECLNTMLTAIREDRRPSYSEEDRDQIVTAGAGMTATDFDTAISRAFVTNAQRLPDLPAEDVARTVLDCKVEMVKRSEVLELVPTVDMDQVGGLQPLKEWITKRSRCFGQDARDAGVEPPKGVALIGPPGTAKSLTAKAVASGMRLPLVKFDISRVFQSLVGQTEGRMHSALKMIEAMSPCVLLVDEIDKVFRSDSSAGDSGVSTRVMGKFLNWMQESDAPVFKVVTANRVNNMPGELLRRGRMDEVFAVQLPAEDERREILNIHLRKRRRDPEQIEHLETAVERSAGYTGSEIEQAVKDAMIEAFTDDEVVLTGELIAQQLEHMVPLSVAFADDFRAMAEWARNNARPANEGEAVQVPTRTRTRQRSRSGHAEDGARGMDLGSGLDG